MELFHDITVFQITEEEIRDQAVEGLITKSIITRDQIVTVYSTTLPYGYPIPTVQVLPIPIQAKISQESMLPIAEGR